MAQGSRPDRVGEQLRQLLSESLAREVHDPGLGFVTLTRVRMSADLQVARILYTSIGDAKARGETKKALERATPFLRRQVGRYAHARERHEPETGVVDLARQRFTQQLADLLAHAVGPGALRHISEGTRLRSG